MYIVCFLKMETHKDDRSVLIWQKQLTEPVK